MRIPMKGDEEPLQARPPELRFAFLKHQLQEALDRLQFRRGDPKIDAQREKVRQMLEDVQALQAGWGKR